MTETFLAGRQIVFFGTPDPAAEVLMRLVDEGFDVCLVVTGRDAKRGRGGALTPSRVKQVALDRGIPVVHDLALVPSDDRQVLGVVVAYGRIIPAALLERIPMVNVHFSLLPRWRGAAPVERAILAGDETTGVCIMEVVDELDAGGVFARREVPVGDATAAELMSALTVVGGDLLVQVLRGPGLEPEPQSGEVTYAHKITPDEGAIDWSDSVDSILRKIRALRSHTSLDGRRVLILAAESAGRGAGRAAGTCSDDAVVECGDGAVRLRSVQPEGKSAMDARQWRRGVRGSVLFGSSSAQT